MIVIQEVWLDLNDDGSACVIRMSAKPEDIHGLDLHKGKRVDLTVAGSDGTIGHAEVRYIACIKGLAILEVARLLPAGAQSRHPGPSLPAFSDPRPVAP